MNDNQMAGLAMLIVLCGTVLGIAYFITQAVSFCMTGSTW